MPPPQYPCIGERSPLGIGQSCYFHVYSSLIIKGPNALPHFLNFSLKKSKERGDLVDQDEFMHRFL
jgi:hypothetical protein